MNPYYQDGSCTIYHGDCREVLAWLEADVLVTDPPYGMAHRSGKNGAFGDCRVEGDHDLSLRNDIIQRWGTKPALVFGTWRIARPPGVRTVLTWDKGELIGMGALDLPWGLSTEEIYVFGRGFEGKRGSSVLRFQALGPYDQARGARHHPTQKPLPLMRALVDKCPPGVIADPFMGSGTTLRAAKDCGRRSIGVEVDERYCEAAARRLAQEVLWAS